MHQTTWKKYIFALFVTSVIFSIAILTSGYFNDKRINELQDIGKKISVDILNLEAQSNLIEGVSCSDVSENSTISNELNSLGEKLSFTEDEFGAENKEVVLLKHVYSLLQITDYLLMKKISVKCDLEPVFIFYFYSNEGDCKDCIKQGYVLTALREKYPQLRVYSFDYNLSLPVLKTLIAIGDIEKDLPAILINDIPYYGFKDSQELESIILKN